MATEIVTSLERCEAVIERGLQTFLEVGSALLEIKQSRLYSGSYATFPEYCEQRWGLKMSRAYQMMSAANVVTNLSYTNVETLPVNEAQARPLASLSPEEQTEVWTGLVAEHGDDITAAVVKQAAQRHRHIKAALHALPEQDQHAIAEVCKDKLDHLNKLADLYRSSKRDGSTDTYGQIISNGGFHYGDEMEKWCDYWNTPILEVAKALRNLAEYHAIIQSAEDEPMPYKDAEDKYRFSKQFAWQERFMPQVEKHIRKHIKDLVTFRIGNVTEDSKQATDLVVTLEGRSISVRLRRANNPYRDMTIRSHIPTGNKTELQKLQDGWGDIYFYGWVADNQIVNYMLVDLNKLRQAGVFHKKRRNIRNPEGTAYVVILRSEIRSAHAMIGEYSYEQY